MPPSFTWARANAKAPNTTILRWGPVDFHTHLLYRFLYGDGIPATANNKVATAMNEIYPGLLVNAGEHWSLDYTPSLHYYSTKLLQDAVNQSASLHGATTNEGWTLGFLQSYISTDEPEVEVAAQLKLETYWINRIQCDA